MKIIEKYTKYFNTQSKLNDMYALMSGHVILGQLAKHVRIPQQNRWEDSRIHLLLLQDSGSGKTAGAGVYRELIGQLQLNLHTLTDFSDASAAGGVHFQEGTGEAREYSGFLADADFVHADEASVLFNARGHQQNMIIYMQTACNPIGSNSNRIDRSLAAGSTQIEPTCSFILTSFPPEKPQMVSNIINNGLLQRMLFFPRILTLDERKQMSQEITKMLYLRGSDTNQHENTEDQITMEELTNEFLEFKAFADTVTHITLEENTNATMNRIVAEMYSTAQNWSKNEIVREKCYGFINRWQISIVKLAAHNAMIDRRTVVNRNDILYGWQIIKPLMNSVFTYMDTVLTAEERKYQRGKLSNHEIIYQSYKQLKNTEYEGIPKGFVALNDLRKLAMQTSNNSQSWWNKELKELKDRGYVSEANVRGNRKYYEILMPDDYKEKSEEVEQPNNQPSSQEMRRKRNRKKNT